MRPGNRDAWGIFQALSQQWITSGMGDLRFNIDAALVLLRELGYRGDALMVEATRFNVIESEYKAMLRDIKDANTVREEFRKRAAEKLKARFGQRDEQQRLLGPGNG